MLSPYIGCPFEEEGSEDPHRQGGKIAENRPLTDVHRRYSGFVANFLWLINVNAGVVRPKKGQGSLHLTGVGRVGVAVGTGKGPGKSMRTRLLKLLFSKLPSSFSSNWGQNHYILYLFGGIIFGNYHRKRCSILFMGELLTAM